MMAKSRIESTKVLGVRVDCLTKEQAVGKVLSLVRSGQKGYAVTVNPEFILTAQTDQKFARILEEANLALVDGIGIVLAARFNRLLGKSQIVPPTTVPGLDLVDILARVCQREHFSIFFLGGRDSVAQKTAEKLKKLYPQLVIAGYFEGDGSEFGDSETRQAISMAADSLGRTIDILFVSYGHPKQEKWIARNIGTIPVTFAMGVGGAFDVLSGKKKVVPRPLRKLGLDWLWRLLIEPSRWKRTFKAVIIFPLRVAFQAFG